MPTWKPVVHLHERVNASLRDPTINYSDTVSEVTGYLVQPKALCGATYSAWLSGYGRNDLPELVTCAGCKRSRRFLGFKPARGYLPSTFIFGDP